MRILAHRGAPTAGTTENTLPAIRSALAGGADGVEVDVRLTADGVLAVCHDRDLQRLTGHPLLVARSSWAQLQAAATGVPLARVEEVLAVAAGRPVVLEVKPAPPDVISVLVRRLAALRADGLALDVTVSSFDPGLVASVREQSRDVGVRTALLGRRGCLPLAVLRQALHAGHDEVHPHVDDLLDDESVVELARRCGVAVAPWTVNDPHALRRCADLGVHALITDVPQAALVATTRRPAAA